MSSKSVRVQSVVVGVLGTAGLVTAAALGFYLLRQRKLKALRSSGHFVEQSDEIFVESVESKANGTQGEMARNLGSVPHFNSTKNLLEFPAACEDNGQKKEPMIRDNSKFSFRRVSAPLSPEKSPSPSPASEPSVLRSQNGEVSGWRHPEGMNIGPTSNRTWRQPADLLEPLGKTDLLHTGHINGGKLVLCMVGLPGRGKSFIARKIARYLRWINYRTRVFSIARFRLEKLGAKQPASFFDPADAAATALREEILHDTLETMMTYLNRGGEVAILDGTNFNRYRRDLIRERVSKEDGYEVMWVETVATDDELVARRIDAMKLHGGSPDFIEESDFLQRVKMYRDAYETLQEDEGAFVKLFNGGKRLEINRFSGFLPTKITSFVMNLQTEPRPVFISRHGESLFNEKGLIGGDPGLSAVGSRYAEVLAEWVRRNPELPADRLCVWTSTMKRTRLTARFVRCRKLVQWRALREIEVGVCDGLTYNQVKELFPEEYRARQEDKLRYRYPRGESYLDVINRLEPILFEIERQKEPLLIVAHQAIHRCLYAYFLDLPAEEVPYLDIPLHTVIKLIPKNFGCGDMRWKLLEGAKHDH